MKNKFLQRFGYKRIKTPTVIQMEMVECGAAALSIILSYYKKFIPLEELRTICGVTRDGSNAKQIIIGAKKLGMHAEGFSKKLNEVYKASLPCILFWKFNHFVVLEGFSKNTFYLNDPATGPRTVSLEEFNESFTGILIELYPTKDFEKGGIKPTLLHSLKRRLKGVFLPSCYTTLATLGLVFPGLAIPVFTQIFFNKILSSDVSHNLFFFLLFLTIILIGSLTLLQRFVLNLLNAKLSILWSSKFFRHILRLPIQFYSQRYPGEIANRLQVNDNVTQVLTGQLTIAAINLIFIFFYLFEMIQMNWKITYITLIATTINILTFILINRSRSDAYARLQQDIGKSIGITAGALRNMETIKSIGTENDFFSRWSGYFTNTSLAQQEINIKDILLTSLPPFMQMITIAAFLTIGGWEVMHGFLSIGMLLALQVLIINFLTPITQFINLGQVLQQVKGDLNRIDDVLDNKEDEIFAKEEGTAPYTKKTRLDGIVELKNLSFGFDPNAPPFIDKFNLTINPGKSIALVGPSGCGKTTLAKLILRLYFPWEGEILFDNLPPKEIDRRLLIRSLSSADQNFFIFEGSFKDNITLWDTTLFEKDIIKAAKDAQIHKEIISTPNGYSSIILEGGKNLSGGQRQRIEIARALVRNPSILILDEATSSLDSETEQAIMQNIYHRGCSSIVVAHRLSTIRNCDEIIVLDKGKIQQKGSHKELKQIPGIYQELVKAQGLES